MFGLLQRVRAFDRLHPLWWDIALTAPLAAVSISATARFDPYAVAVLLVVNGAVVFRRRRPFAALLTAFAVLASAAVVSVLTEANLPWVYIAVWVLLFNVGVRSGERHLVSLAAFIALTGTAAFVGTLDGAAVEIVERVRTPLLVMAMCTVSLLAGTQINSHRATLASQRQEAARAAVVAERSRVAQEMHDIIGHNLSVITSLANGGAVAARDSSHEAQRAFEAIGEVSRSSVREVRRVLAVLRHDQSPDGVSLSPQPGLDDLPALVESVRAAGVHIRYERTGDLRGLSAGRQLAVYRIVQESLTNVLRHAGAGARASVTVEREGDGLVVRVDDSTANPVTARMADDPGEGQGILGMRERAEAYGGTVQASPDSTGWRVRARIPVNPHE